MAGLLLVSSTPASGKTAIAVGLARRLRSAGQLDITEAPAAPIAEALAANPGKRIIIVATPADSVPDIAAFVRSAGPVVGVIMNRVSARKLETTRQQYVAAGVQPLAIVPEDRELAAPTLGQLAAALSAESEHLEGNADRPLDRTIIASIAADPGQTYFTRTDAEAIIVRSDKPDLQLAALNASVSCLIVTGGLPILSYVLQRVAEDEIPLLRTDLDTRQTMEVLESLFGAAPFEGEAKARRIESLLGGLDLDALLERSATA